VITEDYHERMTTAAKGDFGAGVPGTSSSLNGVPNGFGNPSSGGNIPYNAAGERLALAWDPAKDEADGNQCKAYGAAGIMRQPMHLHITWQDDRALKMEIDAGNQTRLLRFGTAGTTSQERTLQGNSAAEWIIEGGRANWARGGKLKVVTTGLKAGYYWKNGMPYSANTRLTEYFVVTKEHNGDVWLNMSLMAEDPEYLTQPWIVTYHFKRLPNGSRWNPTPCSAR
jgi:hypothetical protein